MLIAEQPEIRVSIEDQWSAAVDHLIAALQHLKGMRGKLGEAAAKADVARAQRAYDELSEQLGDGNAQGT